MNLHKIASPLIGAVNQNQNIIWKPSNGYTVDEAGDTMPLYAEETPLVAQVQPLSAEDIQFVNNYNAGAVYRAFYVNGEVNGVNRIEAKGGDLIKWNGKNWYVVNVPEAWNATAGWTKFICALQLGE